MDELIVPKVVGVLAAIINLLCLSFLSRQGGRRNPEFVEFQPPELSIDDDSLWDLSAGATLEIQAPVEFSVTNGAETITMTGPLTLTVQ